MGKSGNEFHSHQILFTMFSIAKTAVPGNYLAAPLSSQASKIRHGKEAISGGGGDVKSIWRDYDILQMIEEEVCLVMDSPVRPEPELFVSILPARAPST